MKRSDYIEAKYKYSLMDPDVLVDALRLSSEELLDMFPQRFEAFLNEEFNNEDEPSVEQDGDEEYRGYGRDPFHDGDTT